MFVHLSGRFENGFCGQRYLSCSLCLVLAVSNDERPQLLTDNCLGGRRPKSVCIYVWYVPRYNSP